jgi:hypothetical protein
MQGVNNARCPVTYNIKSHSLLLSILSVESSLFGLGARNPYEIFTE